MAFFWLAAQLGAGHFSLSSSCPGAGGEEGSLLPPDHPRGAFLKDLVLWHPAFLLPFQREFLGFPCPKHNSSTQR